mmetsp:Transcript_12898/g.19621  ORF Transcript_12898/g.19621 Transcript_12898/m.19621 type:complete len:284 (+) Transcript_12898:52-903(+)
MPRHGNNNYQAQDRSQVQLEGVSRTAREAEQRRSQYHQALKQVNVKTNFLAEMLKSSTNICTALQDDPEGMEFLDNIREEVKGIARENVRRNREIDLFVDSVGVISQELIHKYQNGLVDHSQDIPEYEQVILNKMVEIQAEKEANGTNLRVEDEEIYRDVIERLGEQVQRNGHESDDELQLVDHGPGAESEQALKCPFSGVLFENPVRNKVCGHVYSKTSIETMFRSRKFSCPVAGCTNRRISRDQLEDHVEMAEKVARYKRRLEAQAAQQYDDEDMDINVVE